MKVEYLGHSCFKLTESTGTSVICDPYSEKIGYALPKEACDIITSSHEHYDHNNFAGVEGNPKIVSEPCHFEQNGITISGIPTHHDDEEGVKRGGNIVYKFRMDGVDICHMGDIGHECTHELVEQLLPINVLLVPVGGKFTIDAEMAYDYVEKLMPDIVIPMHYKTRSLDIDIEKVHNFLDLFEDEQIEDADSCEIEVDRSDLNNSETRVIVLKRKK